MTSIAATLAGSEFPACRGGRLHVSLSGSSAVLLEEPQAAMTVPSEPDWERERADLRRFIAHRLAKNRVQPDDVRLDVTTQDALVRLYRWWFRERERGHAIGSLDAMKNNVARFAAIDYVRDLSKEPPPEDRMTLAPSGVAVESGTRTRAPGRTLFTAASRLRYLFLAYVERHRQDQPDYLEMVELRLDDLDWSDIAERLRLGENQLKTRWSRLQKEPLRD